MSIKIILPVLVSISAVGGGFMMFSKKSEAIASPSKEIENEKLEEIKIFNANFQKLNVPTQSTALVPYFFASSNNTFVWEPQNEQTLICEYDNVEYDCEISRSTTDVFLKENSSEYKSYEIANWNSLDKLIPQKDKSTNVIQNDNYKITLKGDNVSKLFEEIFKKTKNAATLKIKDSKNKIDASFLIWMIKKQNEVLLNEDFKVLNSLPMNKTRSNSENKKKIDKKTKYRNETKAFLNSVDSNQFKNFPFPRYTVKKSKIIPKTTKSPKTNGNYLFVTAKADIDFSNANDSSTTFKCSYKSTEYNCEIYNVPFEVNLKSGEQNYTHNDYKNLANLEEMNLTKQNNLRPAKKVTGIKNGFNYKLIITSSNPNIFSNVSNCSNASYQSEITIKKQNSSDNANKEAVAKIMIIKKDNCLLGNTTKFKE